MRQEGAPTRWSPLFNEITDAVNGAAGQEMSKPEVGWSDDAAPDVVGDIACNEMQARVMR